MQRVAESVQRVAVGVQRVAVGVQRVAVGVRRVANGVQRVADGVHRVALHWACDKLPFLSATEEKQNINQCHQTININTRYSLIIPINAKIKYNTL